MDTATTAQAPKGDRKAELDRLRQESVIEIQSHLTNIRVELHQRLLEMQDIPGEEKYDEALHAIVSTYGKEGVRTADLRDVFPDSKRLTSAREALVGKNRITAEKDSNSFLLTVQPVQQ